jgi:hypothetical protein
MLERNNDTDPTLLFRLICGARPDDRTSGSGHRVVYKEIITNHLQEY